VESWPEPVARVAEVLRHAGIDARVEEFPEGTPTAGAAAKAVGASRAQIVKSLVFVCDGLVGVIALAYPHRTFVEVAAIFSFFLVIKGTFDIVVAFMSRSVSSLWWLGLIAGVAQVLLAGELLVHDRVWIGAGSERHMAGISPLDLLRLTNARTAELS